MFSFIIGVLLAAFGPSNPVWCDSNLPCRLIVGICGRGHSADTRVEASDIRCFTVLVCNYLAVVGDYQDLSVVDLHSAGEFKKKNPPHHI